MNLERPHSLNSCLVSLLTPCFNAASFIHRLMDSVLAQTWPCIEMIVVDDGSTDRSREILESYIPKFEAKGYSLVVRHRENGGQSAAVNDGLKLVRGDFLVWPDADDWFSRPFSIERLATALQKAPPEVGIVYSRFRFISDRTFLPTAWDRRRAFENKRQFENCLFVSGGYQFATGSFMVRTEALRETTGMEIWTDRLAGQNWQLLLPLLYRYNGSMVDEFLYDILVHGNSHSRGRFAGTFESEELKVRTYERTILETLSRIRGMAETERLGFERRIRAQYDRLALDVALKWRKRDRIRELTARLGPSGMLPGQRILTRLSFLPGSFRLARFFHGAFRNASGLLRKPFRKRTANPERRP